MYSRSRILYRLETHIIHMCWNIGIRKIYTRITSCLCDKNIIQIKMFIVTYFEMQKILYFFYFVFFIIGAFNAAHPCTRLSPRFIDAIHCYSLLDVNNNPWYDISETM